MVKAGTQYTPEHLYRYYQSRQPSQQSVLDSLFEMVNEVQPGGGGEHLSHH